MTINRKLRQVALAASLALAALGAIAQGKLHAPAGADMDCRQLQAELAALAASNTAPDAAAPGGVHKPGALVVPGAPGRQAGDAAQAQAQAAAVAQVAKMQALAQQPAAAGMGRNQAEATGKVGMLGVPIGPDQTAQPVSMPGKAPIAQLAGSRQEQLGGLYLAKGCK